MRVRVKVSVRARVRVRGRGRVRAAGRAWRVCQAVAVAEWAAARRLAS